MIVKAITQKIGSTALSQRGLRSSEAPSWAMVSSKSGLAPSRSTLPVRRQRSSALRIGPKSFSMSPQISTRKRVRIL